LPLKASRPFAQRAGNGALEFSNEATEHLPDVGRLRHQAFEIVIRDHTNVVRGEEVVLELTRRGGQRPARFYEGAWSPH
jgi:hypothetical protein